VAYVIDKEDRNIEEYILYILYIPKQNAYKVGITTIIRFEKRLYEIESSFGKIKFNNSCYYKSKSKMDIDKTEQAIHNVSWNFKKNIKKGSGKTEFILKSKITGIRETLQGIQKINKIKGPFYFKKSYSLKYIFIYFIIISISIFIMFDKDMLEILETFLKNQLK